MLTVLLGCTSPPSDPPPFDTEESAALAAKTSIDLWLADLNEFYSRSGDDPTVYEDTETADLYSADLRSYEDRGDRTQYANGEFSYFDFSLMQNERSETYPTVFMRVRMCLDFREIQWFTMSDEAITYPDRDPWTPREISLVEDPDDPTRLLVDDINTYVGYNFCPVPRAHGDARPSP